MARRGIEMTTVRTSAFASAELTEFVYDLSTTTPRLPVTEGDLVGALILAARRSPMEAVKAYVHAYWDREAELAAALAVCGFLQAHG